MATIAIILSTGSSSGPGTPGRGRQNLVIGETVTLSDTEVTNVAVSYLWEFVDIPIGSAAVLVDATTATPTFEPDVEGTYWVKVTVNSLFESSEELAVELPITNGRIPAFREKTEYDADGNTKGWHEAQTAFMRNVDTLIGDLLERVEDIEDLVSGGDLLHTTDVFVGDVSGTYATTSVDKVKGHTVGSLTNGEVLYKSGASAIGSLSRSKIDTSAVYTDTSFVGDVSGAYNVTSVDKVKGHTVGTLTLGQVVYKDGASSLASITRAAIDTTAVHSGDAAGGSIGGTYPTSLTVTKLNETGGPTALTIGAIADGQVGYRTAGTFIGLTRAAIDTTAIHSGDAASGTVGGTFPSSLTVNQLVPEVWAVSQVPATQTGVAMSVCVSTLFDSWTAIRAGSIVGLRTKFDTPVTAGTLTLTVAVNGTAKTLAVASTSGSNASGGVATQAAGTDTFVAGDLISILYTSTNTFTPITLNMEGYLEVKV